MIFQMDPMSRISQPHLPTKTVGEIPPDLHRMEVRKISLILRQEEMRIFPVLRQKETRIFPVLRQEETRIFPVLRQEKMRKIFPVLLPMEAVP